MSFKLAIFAALATIARAGYINGGHVVGTPIGGSYVSNGGLLRSGSSYSSPYSYGDAGFSVGSGRGFSSGVSGPIVSVRPGSYGSGYSNYGSRNSAGGVPSYQTISGYGSRTLSYPQPTYASAPILRNGYHGFQSFNGVYSTPFPATLNYGHQSIPYSTSIPHQTHGGPYNGLGNGYGY